ncbi:MAG TPA: zinc ABC transporter substrate-binding protein [Clostridiales bacterium]|nr:zinc ABC transporter substrate-binding protein [Clostridiales bacterium]
MKKSNVIKVKIFIAILTICVVAIGCLGLVACDKTKDDGKLSIVCTIFPEYDWTKQILGDEAKNVDLTLLLDDGVDLHSYQPSVEDIAKISTCDLFIYVGGESDEWVDKALENATNKDMKVINLLEVLGEKVKNEETVEGMEGEHEHEHEEEHEEEKEEEKDEHVWLSLKNASILCDKIASDLKALDSKNAEKYDKNLAEYKSSLSELDGEYASAVKNAKYNTLVFGDRFPFRYLVDDYNLKYYAAFVGCSAETEASFETIAFLAGKVDELSLPAICTIEGAKHEIAKTVKDNTKTKDQKIVTFDSMQSTTSQDIANGETYLSAMRGNLNSLKTALGE